ncbi:MAG: SAM hydroxide adenosyltransferase [Pirellulaceae bacterium]
MAAKLTGKIVAKSEAGDLVTDIRAEQLREVPRDDRVSIKCGGHATVGIYATDHRQPEMTFLAVIDGDGVLVLTLVGDSAAEFLGLRVGDQVTLKW